MASIEQCRAALARLADAVAANAAEVREKVTLDRRLVCRVTDLDVTFRGRLHGGQLRDIHEGDDPHAQVTLSATSDDLIALIDGDLDVAKALATRRISVKASPFDMLKLRKLL